MKFMIKKELHIPLSITSLAFLLRIILLEHRPPHFDEGTTGFLVDQITKEGFYTYNPSFFHGPLNFYLLFIMKTLFGKSLWVFRLPNVILGTLAVFLVTRFDRFLSKPTAYFAALAMAVSPAMVYFSRYPFQDTGLLLFSLLFLWGLVGLWKEGTVGFLWVLGWGFAGMMMMKETYLIELAGFAIAAACLKWSDPIPCTIQKWNRRDLFVMMSSVLAALIFFYSNGLSSFSALNNIRFAAFDWGKIAVQGQGHIKPFYYWISLILRYEWPALIGMVAGLFYFLKKDPFLKFIAFYGWAVLILFSLIPYKTPWCLVEIIWPFFFLFGGCIYSLSHVANRIVVYTFAWVTLAVSFVEAAKLNYFHDSDPEHSYVYVQTLPSIYKLMNPIRDLVSNDPSKYHIKGAVIYHNPWPLPWLLSDFTQVSYEDSFENNLPIDADFLVVDPSDVPKVEKELKNNYYTIIFDLRPGEENIKAYFNAKTFHSQFKDRDPDFIPSGVHL